MMTTKFKRLLSMVCIIALCFTMVIPAYAASEVFVSGDINGDDVVGTKDVTVLRRYIAGGYDVAVIDEALDVNHDGTITTKDVTILRRFIAGGYGVEIK